MVKPFAPLAWVAVAQRGARHLSVPRLTLTSCPPRSLGFLAKDDPAAIAIVVAAAALRLVDLGRRALWFDDLDRRGRFGGAVVACAVLESRDG